MYGCLILSQCFENRPFCISTHSLSVCLVPRRRAGSLQLTAVSSGLSGRKPLRACWRPSWACTLRVGFWHTLSFVGTLNECLELLSYDLSSWWASTSAAWRISGQSVVFCFVPVVMKTFLTVALFLPRWLWLGWACWSVTSSVSIFLGLLLGFCLFFLGNWLF